ncbi:T9SS type A sorting domain-containing protein [candidate division KSB1 bacterium]|nr:T9SS type A sorting domain-containing protein [candidate division KSB1 bacterium]
MEVNMKTRTALLLTSLFLAQTLFSQTFQQIGSWSEGPCFDAITAGEVLYFSNGNYFEIIDYADAENPVMHPRVDTENPVTGFAIVNNQLWTGSWFGGDISLYDISDATTPVLVERFPWFQESFCVTDRFLFLNEGYNQKIKVYDSTDPAQPLLQSEISLDVRCQYLTASDSSLFLQTGSGRLSRYCLSDPQNPRPAWTYDHGKSINNLLLYNSYLFCGTTEGVDVFDISDPDTLTHRFTFGGTTTCKDIFIKGDSLFVAAWFNGVDIYDIQNLETPVKIGNIANLYRGIDHVSVNSKCIFAGDRLFGIQARARTDLSLIGHHLVGGQTLDIAVKEPYVYVAGEFFGIKIIDVSDPQSVVLVDTVRIGGRISTISSIQISGELLVANLSGSFRLYNLQNPVAPELICDHIPELWGNVYTIQDSLIYIVNPGEFGIVDVSDPGMPELKGKIPFTTYPEHMAVIDSFAVVADRNNQLVVINVADPQNPVIAATIPQNGRAGMLEVDDNKLYVLVRDRISIYGSRALPELETADDQFSSQAFSGSVLGDKFFAMELGFDGDYLVSVYEEHPSSGWNSVASLPISFYIYAFEHRPGRLYISGFYEGFQILQYQSGSSVVERADQPQEYTVLRNYPNPFNSETRIEYSIQKPGNVTLKICNILGEHIETLVDAFQDKGSYSLPFDAAGYSSGIYYYTLQCADGAVSEKMILLR